MITAAKIAFRNSCGSSIISRPLSRARRQCEEGDGEDRTARAVQFENVLDIDLSCPDAGGYGSRRPWRQSLIPDLIEPVQSDEPASAIGSHMQAFAFSRDVPGFRVIWRGRAARQSPAAWATRGDGGRRSLANEGVEPDGRHPRRRFAECRWCPHSNERVGKRLPSQRATPRR
jgi:hypothetical protein